MYTIMRKVLAVYSSNNLSMIGGMCYDKDLSTKKIAQKKRAWI